MRIKNKTRITGVFLLAIMSLSIMITVSATLASANAAKSFMTSENIVVQDRVLEKIVEHERLLDKTWEDDRLLGRDSQSQYKYGIGGFGSIGYPRDLPF